mmetsp:Transcript_35653/g.45967  ORF Transcript_35653/g.45967 Transcript_35653/m.45967 type:complete len:91 (+) Transcript_35653:353-625(+)
MKQAAIEYTVSIEANKSSGLQVASVVVKVNPSLASAVDLEVGFSELRLSVPQKAPLQLPLPFRIDESKTKAKYSKKTESLKVTLTESAAV